MTTGADAVGDRPCWFVGALFGIEGDQWPRFLKEGIWENGYEDRYLNVVRAVRPGDRIALKAAYTRKYDLPFDNKGQIVSVMSIKGIGTVTENLGDGRHLRVNWIAFESPREWYFFTNRLTIWKVLPGDWMTDALIDFAFNRSSQDFAKFRNAPHWRERFGDAATDTSRFQWTRFYEALADKLLEFQKDRSRLVAEIHAIAGRVTGLSNLQDQFADGTTGPLKDICPFTAFGIFNRGVKDSNRKEIARQLAHFLGVQEPVPETFEGIPILNNQKSWFFAYEKHRRPDDIDALWNVFSAAIEFARSDDPDIRDRFIAAFDEATSRQHVAWNLTCGLYWIRPWAFAPLDRCSREYLTSKLAVTISLSGHKHLPSAADYLDLLDSLDIRFREETFAVHSFPELSLEAWRFVRSGDGATPPPPLPDGSDDNADGEVEPRPATVSIRSYSIDDIVADGSFLDRAELTRILDRLRTKKALILQGPPGTGKTWLAKRLAFALMGERDENRLKVLQFHPNMSYEDFVRGWRPTGEGKLALVDGPLMEAVRAASQKPAAQHVIVIEEINRGNPAQMFGEMLTLIEADKRTPDEAIQLCHATDGDRVFIPNNVYIIGTMNIADRSLALVDYALRRRFAFVNLEPKLGPAWRNWVFSRCSAESGVLDEIQHRIELLNEQISADPVLGKPFRIGHSYVTPPVGIEISSFRDWFMQVVETEIGPLLDEYWFDTAEKAKEARRRLTDGL